MLSAVHFDEHAACRKPHKHLQIKGIIYGLCTVSQTNSLYHTKPDRKWEWADTHDISRNEKLCRWDRFVLNVVWQTFNLFNSPEHMLSCYGCSVFGKICCGLASQSAITTWPHTWVCIYQTSQDHTHSEVCSIQQLSNHMINHIYSKSRNQGLPILFILFRSPHILSIICYYIYIIYMTFKYLASSN